MKPSFDELLGSVENKKVRALVVRLSTSCWITDRGICMKKNIETMKKLSGEAYDILREDSSNMDPALVFGNIVNLGECKDGLYSVVTCNEFKDWETGNIEDYDYRLLPYKPHETTQKNPTTV